MFGATQTVAQEKESAGAAGLNWNGSISYAYFAAPDFSFARMNPKRSGYFIFP